MTQTFKDFNPKTVIIGNQVWMAENLSITDGGEGIYYNENNKQYYYTWDAAMRIAESIPGWHLPTAEEWNAAAEACGASVVDNPYMPDYKGTEKLYDTLKVLPIGDYYDGSFRNVYFWSATEYGSSLAYLRDFVTRGAMRQYRDFKDYGFSVRFVKDSEVSA